MLSDTPSLPTTPKRPSPPQPPSSPKSPSTPPALTAFLTTLPSKSNGFTCYDAAFPPVPDVFDHYLPSSRDTASTMKIPHEKDRCLIRALKGKPTSRKRPAPPPVAPTPRKRYSWAALQRERKQACLRVALVAACSGRPTGDDVLGRLRRAWAENPRKKQLVGYDVRKALCDSLPRWSLAQLREYVARADVPAGDTRQELVAAVSAHLGPEE